MTLRTQVRGMWLLGAAMVLGLFILVHQISGRTPGTFTLILLIPATGILIGIQILLVHRAQRRIEQAFARADRTVLRQQLSEMADYFRDQPELHARFSNLLEKVEAEQKKAEPSEQASSS